MNNGKDSKFNNYKSEDKLVSERDIVGWEQKDNYFYVYIY